MTKNEIPAHTHTRGTMNITGRSSCQGNDQFYNDTEGAFYTMNKGHVDSGTSSANTYMNRVGFDASRAWTGATSSVGGSQGHNHGNTGSTSTLPPYISLYIWERIS